MRDEAFWRDIRRQFLLAPDLLAMNAANLAPASIPVIDVLYASMLDLERDPSPFNRAKLAERIEVCRERLADSLHVHREDIVITRNASEANNLVSSGLDLKPGDQVLIYSDNHPSNNAAWREKARRSGFAVDVVTAVTLHPGAERYVEEFSRRMSARTRIVALTHVASQAGDVLPVRDICRAARSRGILTLVDGAQSFGVLPIDLSDMRPDFFTASAHKWACGPKGVGFLYLDPGAQPRISPSIVSTRPGLVGISTRLEALGQRDEAAIGAFVEALALHARIGIDAIEARARALAQMLVRGLQKIDGVELWTHPDPQRSGAIVSFKPRDRDPAAAARALYTEHRIVCASRAGDDRPGLRFSPHLYNSPEEIERALGAIEESLKSEV